MKPLEFVINKTEEDENGGDEKQKYTGIVFSNYALSLVKKPGSFEARIIYPHLPADVINRTHAQLGITSGTVDNEGKATIVLTCRKLSFAKAKSKIIDMMGKLHEKVPELKLEDAIETVKKVTPAAITLFSGAMLADSAVISYTEEKTVTYYRREGPFSEGDSEYAKLMKEEVENKRKGIKTVFPKGMPSKTIETLVDEASHYLNRSFAFYKEGEEFKDDEKRYVKAYRDAERSARILHYVFNTSVANKKADEEDSLDAVGKFSDALMQMAFSAAQILEIRNDYSRAMRLFARINEELEILCIYLKPMADEEERKRMIQDDDLDEDDEPEFKEEYKSVLDAQALILEKIKDLEKTESHTASVQAYTSSKMTPDEVPLMMRMNFITKHEEFLEHGSKVVALEKKIEEASDYLGFLSDESFVF